MYVPHRDKRIYDNAIPVHYSMARRSSKYAKITNDDELAPLLENDTAKIRNECKNFKEESNTTNANNNTNSLSLGGIEHDRFIIKELLS